MISLSAGVHLLYVNTRLLPEAVRPGIWPRVGLVALVVFYGVFSFLSIRALIAIDRLTINLVGRRRCEALVADLTLSIGSERSETGAVSPFNKAEHVRGLTPQLNSIGTKGAIEDKQRECQCDTARKSAEFPSINGKYKPQGTYQRATFQVVESVASVTDQVALRLISIASQDSLPWGCRNLPRNGRFSKRRGDYPPKPDEGEKFAEPHSPFKPVCPEKQREWLQIEVANRSPVGAGELWVIITTSETRLINAGKSDLADQSSTFPKPSATDLALMSARTR